MQIAVGSKNPVKLEAVRLAFEAVWPEESLDVVGVEVISGVSGQPMSDAESVQGARARARGALEQHSEAIYGVGLEGGLQEIAGSWYDCGWAAVRDREGQEGLASTSRIAAPEAFMRMIREGKELGEAADIFFREHNSKQGAGYFGLMTNGSVTRTSAYRQAVIVALSRFLHPELFD